MKESVEFTRAYADLNEQQRQAVDTIEGPVMVVAGPGTGKTQILTLRIANILRSTDTEPENILALTFTEAAATNMKKRLARLIGSHAHQVTITTFHAFANDIIQNNPDEFPAIIGAHPMTEIDQVRIVQESILNLKLEFLKPFGDTLYYVRPVVSALNQLKREGVSVERFLEIISTEESIFENTHDLYHDKGAHKGKMKGVYQVLQKKIAKNKELAIIYEAYQKRIRAEKRYDFTDMIMETAMTLKTNTDLLMRLQETYQYILVDEHQDTNNAQNNLLELLANFHDDPNLFVVGDERQSIFRFQGANVENFFYFKHLYPRAVLINLQQNYRSVQTVLDVADSLMSGDTKLVSHRSARDEQSGRAIEVVSYATTHLEIMGIADRVANLIRNGVEPAEIAVLYRNNRDALDLARVFKSKGIPHVVESQNDVFTDPYMIKLLTLLRAVADFGNDEVLARALHLDIVEADPFDVVRIIRSASQKRKYSLYDCCKNLEKHMKESGIELYKPLALHSFFNSLERWVGLAHNADLVSVVEVIIRESGLLQNILGSAHPEQDLENLQVIFNEIRNFAAHNKESSLRDFVTSLDMMREHGLSLEKSLPGGTPGYVRLMTAHRSKGQEFEYVFITHVVNGNWGNKARRDPLPLLEGVFRLHDLARDHKSKKTDRESDSDGEEGESDMSLDDERRLFYVALTRAKQQVTITFSHRSDEGREYLRSQLVDEIDPALLVCTEEDMSEVDHHATTIPNTPVPTDTKAQTRENMQAFVRATFLKQGLSVSALNNYLQSPWQYFFRNLVRIPAAPDKFQAYGIAVHATLNDVFNELREGNRISKDGLLQRFDMHLDRQVWISSTDQHDAQDKGYHALSAWYDAYAESFEAHTLNEFRINGVYLTPEIKLTGALDKIEFIDGSSHRVHVVDYKTGKPKSRKQIMGETKDADGNYYRQLVFYKLLLKYFNDGAWYMESGELDFIEPDEKGKLHKEKFMISDEEVSELEETIKRVADEIMIMSFWDTVPDPESCEYADLVEALKSR